MVRPDGRAERNVRGIAAADSGDNPVGFREIEARIGAERHHGGSRFGRADAGQHAENAVVVHAHVVVAGRNVDDLIEMLAFDPKLKLAGRVARVFAPLKHGNHDNFDLDGLWRWRCLTAKRTGAERGRYEGSAETSDKPAHEFPSLGMN